MTTQRVIETGSELPHDHEYEVQITARSELTDDILDVVDTFREKRILQRSIEEKPFVVLAAAAGTGFVLAGGLLSPFSRRLARIGVKGALVGMAVSQIKQATQS